MTPDEIIAVIGIFGILSGIMYQIYQLSQRMEKATLFLQTRLEKVMTTIELCPNCPHYNGNGDE